MKKLFIYVLAALLVSPLASNAQDTKDLQKERKEIRKASMAELNEKVSKDAKKEAKKLKKEGWITTPGTLPIEKRRTRQTLWGGRTDANPKLSLNDT